MNDYLQPIDNIKNLIYTIRGEKVMLDFDLAKIYGYSTKAFNQQVQRNIEKFEGEDFMFQLTREETGWLSMHKGTNPSRSQFVTLKDDKRGYNIKYLPHAFTEQGVYMLMTVLKGNLAITQSRALIRIFKSMKNYIAEHQNLVERSEFIQLSSRVDQISAVIQEFTPPKREENFIFLQGELLKADEAYIELYSRAKTNLYIVDNYVGIKTLHHLRKVNPAVKIFLLTDDVTNGLFGSDLKDFKKEFPNLSLEIKKTNNKIHDRVIALDLNTKNEKIYHAGASSKDAGNRMTTITKFESESIKTALRQLLQDLTKE